MNTCQNGIVVASYVPIISKIDYLNIDAEELHSLCVALVDAITLSVDNTSEFVPALRLLMRRLAELQRNISDLDETVNKLWEDREKAAATQLKP